MIAPSLLILAAGLGSRYGGFKQIEPIGPNGELIIDYSVYDAVSAGFGKIVLMTRPELEEPLREHFAKTLGDQVDFTFAFQKMDDLPDGFSVPHGRQKPWGTGHAVWAARHVIDGPFAVINADDFYGASSYRLLRDFLAENREGVHCLAGFELAKTLSAHGSVSRGICQVDFKGNLTGVVEHPEIRRDLAFGARTRGKDGLWRSLSPTSIASMNLWGFDPSIMKGIGAQFRQFLAANGSDPKAEFYLPTSVDAIIRSREASCQVLVTDEQWFGMTYKEDHSIVVEAVTRLIADGVYPQSLVPALSGERVS